MTDPGVKKPLSAQGEGMSTMNEEQAKKMQRLIARTWSDEDFKKRLLADPAAVLKEEGLDMPAGMKIHIYENSENVFHLVLSPKPVGRELTGDEMEGTVGGSVNSQITDAITQ